MFTCVHLCVSCASVSIFLLFYARVQLEPFPIVVRCCNRCNDTQLRLVKEAKERAERARLFVQNHLSLLEEGGQFDCIHRSDILRTLVLDGFVLSNTP